MDIRKTEFDFESQQDGLKISALRIEPAEKENIKGIVQFVHGMSEHKERYEDIMRFMAEHGYLCVIHDHRGHGKSIKAPEDLGYMYEAKNTGLVEDAHQMTTITKDYAKELTGKNLPYMLLGHSMGSLVVRAYIKKYDSEIDKLVVMGCPSKLPGMGAGLVLVKALRFFKGGKSKSKLMDFMTTGSNYESKFKDEGRGAWLNTDAEEVAKYGADPLCGFSFTVNGYESLVTLTKDVYSGKGHHMSNSGLKVRFLSGRDDPCGISPEKIEEAADVIRKAGYKDVTVKTYEGMRHEILLAPDRHLVYEDILKIAEE